MRTPQTRMTLALALALGTGTLAALAVGPVDEVFTEENLRLTFGGRVGVLAAKGAGGA